MTGGGAHADGVTPLRQALNEAVHTLTEAGVPSPRADAELLAAHLLSCRRSELALFDVVPTYRYAALVRRRATREPLQHVTGVAHFRHVSLAVGPGVFVPRPETEVVTGWAVEVLQRLLPHDDREGGGNGTRSPHPHDQRVYQGVYQRVPASPVAVDLGTGAGPIALSLAVEVPEAEVHAVEGDESAYGWATRNLLGSGVTLHHSELSLCLPELDGRVDLVVSNPPYVPETLRGRLDPEVEQYDPPAALWAGADGLDGLRQVAAAARRLLRPGGVLAVEHHDTHAEQAVALLTHAGWRAVTDHTDLAGRARFVTATRPDGNRP